MAITEREYLDRKGIQYKKKGEELQAKYCPMCGGGKHKDTYTFGLNEVKHTYKCQRGSCGASGTFRTLAEQEGEVAQYYLDYLKKNGQEIKTVEVQKREFVVPKFKLNTAEDTVLNYFGNRGISKEVIEKHVSSAKANGVTVAAFKFFYEGKHCCTKFRYLDDRKKNKETFEKDGLQVLWNWESIDLSKPVILTEGMVDALSCIEAGHTNVVSVPSGCTNFKWLENNYEEITKVENWILYMDNDQAGDKMKEELILKLGSDKISVVEHDLKDANEELMLYGAEQVKWFIDNARPLPVDGLVDVSTVEIMDMQKIEKVTTGIQFIDESLGGLIFPSLNVWTGKRGGGKSTMITQAIIKAIEQDKKIFIYSGELSVPLFKLWLYRQIATERHIHTEVDYECNRHNYKVNEEAELAIDAWLKGKVWLYDDTLAGAEDKILKLMEQSYKKYDCRVFVLDNLTTVKLNPNKAGKYEGQSLFVDRLRQFCLNTKTTINLVVHPKKSHATDFDNDDVGGSGDITNLAFGVINIRRIKDKDKDLKQDEIDRLNKLGKLDLVDCIGEVTKNRYFGNGATGYYRFNKPDNRFMPLTSAGYITRAWEQYLPNGYKDQLGREYTNKNKDISLGEIIENLTKLDEGDFFLNE